MQQLRAGRPAGRVREVRRPSDRLARGGRRVAKPRLVGRGGQRAEDGDADRAAEVIAHLGEGRGRAGPLRRDTADDEAGPEGEERPRAEGDQRVGATCDASSWATPSNVQRTRYALTWLSDAIPLEPISDFPPVLDVRTVL